MSKFQPCSSDLTASGKVAPGQYSLLDLLPGETPTLSRRCQRWTGRTMAWQLADPERRFDARRYTVRLVEDDATAKRYVTANHYSGSYVSALWRFGLYRDGQLVGIAVFSNPGGGPAVLTSVLPELTPCVESMELGRFFLAQDEPGNTESWFLARCLDYLTMVGVRAVVSFADPMPRQMHDGTIVAPGHVGWIYQATNALYTGRSVARTLWLLPDGTVLNETAKQKIRDQKQGHRYAEKMLIRWGAQPMRAGQDPKMWLRQAGYDAGVRLFRHYGCHRYVFLLGTRRERRDVLVAPSPAAYPKQRDAPTPTRALQHLH